MLLLHGGDALWAVLFWLFGVPLIACGLLIWIVVKISKRNGQPINKSNQH